MSMMRGIGVAALLTIGMPARIAAADAIPAREEALARDAVGVAALTAGDLPAALREFRGALAMLERRVAANPDQFLAQRDAEVSRRRIGIVLIRMADFPAAEAMFFTALSDIDRMRAAFPNEAILVVDRNGVLSGLMSVAGGRGDVPAAMRYGLQAVEPGSAVTDEATVRDWLILAQTLAHYQRIQGDTTGALATLTAATRWLDRLPAEQHDWWHVDRSSILVATGDVQEEQGDAGAALSSYNLALASAKAAGPRSGANSADEQLVSVYRTLGQFLFRQERFRDSMEANGAAVALCRKMLAGRKQDFRIESELGKALTLFGDDQDALQQPEAAADTYREVTDIFERLLAANPADTDARRSLGLTLGRLMRLAINRGDKAGAVAYGERRLDTATRLAALDPSNAQWQSDLAFAQGWQATALRNNGDVAAADVLVRDGLRTMRALVKGRPYNKGWEETLAWFEAQAGQPPAIRLR